MRGPQRGVRHEPFVARGERAAVDRRGEGLAADGTIGGSPSTTSGTKAPGRLCRRCSGTDWSRYGRRPKSGRAGGGVAHPGWRATARAEFADRTSRSRPMRSTSSETGKTPGHIAGSVGDCLRTVRSGGRGRWSRPSYCPLLIGCGTRPVNPYTAKGARREARAESGGLPRTCSSRPGAPRQRCGRWTPEPSRSTSSSCAAATGAPRWSAWVARATSPPNVMGYQPDGRRFVVRWRRFARYRSVGRRDGPHGRDGNDGAHASVSSTAGDDQRGHHGARAGGRVVRGLRVDRVAGSACHFDGVGEPQGECADGNPGMFGS
ncbi:hypothetical protein STENM223S_01860 [Streptomyces tendae]